MQSNFYIDTYCHIENGSILLDGKTLFENASTASHASSLSPESSPTPTSSSSLASHDLEAFLKSAYKHFGTDYPKFFKMDRLSKLAFMAAEVLLGHPNASEEERNLAIVLANRASSLDTDRKYQESIADPHNFYPSPAVFVYTLPNICIGEISIRHRLRSENSFFIFDAFEAGFMADYATSLLQTEKADEVLCGWVDVDGDSYRAFLYLVSKNGNLPHTALNTTKIYSTP